MRIQKVPRKALKFLLVLLLLCLAQAFFHPSVNPHTITRVMSSYSGGSTLGGPVPHESEPRWLKFQDPVRIANALSFPADLKLTFTGIQCEQKRIKCYVLSDLHADAEKNQAWVRENCFRREEDSDVFTVFILPGDIGSEIDRLESVFRVLVANYNAVVYTPGNHEAWRRGTAAGGSATRPELRAENRMAADSVVKIVEVVECARACGVYVGPIRVEKSSGDGAGDGVGDGVGGESTALTVFPLYSWYHSGFDTEPDLDNEMYLAVEEVMPFDRKWGDFTMCGWPAELGLSHGDWASTARTPGREDNTVLAEAFASLNEPFLLSPAPRLGSEETEGRGVRRRGVCAIPSVKDSDTIISFSHFLPRQELCPEKRFLIEPLLSRVIGSDPLEAQVRRLNPHLHLFGHTHIPIDLKLEGIRYLQWPLGYSREADKQCAPIHAVGPLLVYDSACGVGAEAIPERLPSLSAAWTAYYSANRRDPSNSNLAPWLLQRLDSFSGMVRGNMRADASVESTSKH